MEYLAGVVIVAVVGTILYKVFSNKKRGNGSGGLSNRPGKSEQK
jgi:hypothetical protein